MDLGPGGLNNPGPKGEKLAYINNREAELLKRMGGAGYNELLTS
jgi:hypothetical protein